LSVFRSKPEPETVALESWKDVKMHVEDFLPRRLTIGQEEVDALSLQSRSPNSSRQLLCHPEQTLAQGGIEIRQVFGVQKRDDQQVTRCDGLNVHEGNASVVPIDNAHWSRASHNVAEDAGGH